MILQTPRSTLFPYTTLFRSRATRWNVSAGTMAGTGISSHSSQGRSTVLLARGVLRSASRSEEHTSELQSRLHLVCRLLLEKKNSSAGMVDAGFENQQELTKM